MEPKKTSTQTHLCGRFKGIKRNGDILQMVRIAFSKHLVNMDTFKVHKIPWNMAHWSGIGLYMKAKNMWNRFKTWWGQDESFCFFFFEGFLSSNTWNNGKHHETVLRALGDLMMFELGYMLQSFPPIWGFFSTNFQTFKFEDSKFATNEVVWSKLLSELIFGLKMGGWMAWFYKLKQYYMGNY